MDRYGGFSEIVVVEGRKISTSLLPKVEVLFQRIDKKVIETETEKLKAIL